MGANQSQAGAKAPPGHPPEADITETLIHAHTIICTRPLFPLSWPGYEASRVSLSMQKPLLTLLGVVIQEVATNIPAVLTLVTSDFDAIPKGGHLPP